MALKLMVIAPWSGLGDRMFVIGSCIRFARKMGIPYKLAWINSSALTCPLDMLFRCPVETYDLNSFVWNGWGNIDVDPKKGYSNSNIWVIKDGNELTNEMMSCPDVLIINGWAIPMDPYEKTYRDDKIFQDILVESVGMIMEWPLNPYVESERDRFVGQYALSKCLGVHFRDGDLKCDVGYGTNRIIPLSRYFNTLDKRGENLFLATDSEEAESEFLKRYGDRVCMYRCRTKNRAEPEAIQDALIQMILLSRCSRILCGRSNFNLAAQCMGRMAHVEFEKE